MCLVNHKLTKRANQSNDMHNGCRQVVTPNKFFHCNSLTTAESRAIVKPCPDLLYSNARLDFTQPGVRAVKLSFVNPGTYSSLSFFSDITDNFFVANFDTANPNAGDSAVGDVRTVIVLGPREKSIDICKAKKILGVDEIVVCPTKSGTVLQRVFCPTRDTVMALRKTQEKATCTPLFELPRGMENVESVESTPLLVGQFKTPGSGFIFVSCMCLATGYSMSDWRELLSAWKILVAMLLGLWAVPFCLGSLFTPWMQPMLPIAMQPVNLGCFCFNPKTGSSSADSFVRAYVALVGLLALNKSEAIYMLAASDSDGNELDCCHDYAISCPKAMPGAWWSITAYGGDHYLIPNC